MTELPSLPGVQPAPNMWAIAPWDDRVILDLGAGTGSTCRVLTYGDAT